MPPPAQVGGAPPVVRPPGGCRRARRASPVARLVLAAALAVAAGAAGAQPLPPAAPRVSSVELALPAGEDPEPVRALVAVEDGEPLSARSLRRTVQRIFQTGRYRNVVVRAVPDAPPPGGEGRWVRLVVEALPLRVVAEVRVAVEGAGVDEEAVRAAAGLAAGARFDAGDLAPAERRVRAALARRGFRSPEVTARARGDLSVVVELAVRPGAPVRVGAVRITGDPGPAAALLEEALRLRPGDALDDEALEADVRRLRAALHGAGHRRGRVGAPVVEVQGELARVEIPVQAGPRLVFAFRGNEQVAAAVLLREAGFEEGQPVDVPAVGAAVDRLVAFYRSRGHAAARVEAEEVRRGADLQVVFHVDEGVRYRVLPVRFEGAQTRSEAWLRARLAALLDEDAADPDQAEADRARALVLSVPGARPPPSPPPAVPPHAAWDEDAWARAVEQLADDYRADGFLEALHLGTSVVLDARRRTAQVTVRLREGERTHVEAISFEGNEAVSLPELARLARLAPGDPLVFERVEATRAAILRVYLSRGHLYARVEARELVDRERHLAAVRFVVSEGPKVRIGRIVVSGNRRTREGVVRRALALDEGGTYDPEAVQRSQAALLRLGVFRSVSLRLQDPEVPHETKDVAVELAERPWATLTQGVGFSIANGPRAFVEYARPNLLGRALELSARAKVNYPIDEFRPDLEGKAPVDRVEGRADVGLRSASFSALSLPTALRTDVIAEILHRKAYDLRRVTGVTGVDLGITSRVGFSLQYELEVDRIAKSGSSAGFLTQADVERLRFDEGDTTLHALRPSITLDYRDNSVHPHRGWFAAGAVEYARSLGGPGERILLGALPASDIHTNMLKAWGTASGYLPVGAGTVVALSLRGGRVFPLDGRSRTVIPRRFFLGGATTMRGFAEEEMLQEDVRSVLAAEARHCATSPSGVGCTPRGRRIVEGERPVSEGGEAFLLAKAELRMRLRGSLEGGIFADVGNLWLDPEKYRLLDLRANVGLGLRFVTPIGPAAVDFGFNLDPDAAVNERTVAPHFTIGLF
jgi:outer membrane protein insertion porin family